MEQFLGEVQNYPWAIGLGLIGLAVGIKWSAKEHLYRDTLELSGLNADKTIKKLKRTEFVKIVAPVAIGILGGVAIKVLTH